MKAISKMFVTGMLASSVSLVSAAPIFNVSDEGLTAAQNAEAVFKSKLNSGFLTEDFDSGYTVGAQSTTITSVEGVGSFTMDQAGTGGECNTMGYDCDKGLAVLDEDSSPFSGRFDVSPDNWLDSMDAQKLTYSPTEGYNALGFYMTDPNDVGGRFSIGGDYYDFEDIFGSALGNGEIFYVTLFDDTGLKDLTIEANTDNDGYGIDDVTVGTVPEPGTIALFGLGLLGLGLSRRRNKA